MQNEPYTCKAPSPTMNNGLDSWEASSSSQSSHDRPLSAAHRDDENDLGRPDASDSALLGDDPLHSDLAPPISFKRKKKPALFDFAQPARLITNLNGHRTSPSGGSRPDSSYGRGAQEHGPTYLENLGASPRRRGGANGNSSSKEPLDWYVEGPGRRVGYEDLTAIDWIFEYTKERTRLRVLRSNTQGLMGKLQLAFDSAQEWVILVLTGLLVGTLAAVIDITTDWLGDLKTGYCTTRDGGAFYLNKAFCCMGYDEGAQCMGWRPWAAALNISSGAGKWILEYFFFIMFSVCLASLSCCSGPPKNNSDEMQVFFAFCASILVKEYAMYAKHSGIPEIKTVLGGFVIRRFLGAWTLVTKSLGLVCCRSFISSYLSPFSDVCCSVWLWRRACGWAKRDLSCMWPAVAQISSSSYFLSSTRMRVSFTVFDNAPAKTLIISKPGNERFSRLPPPQALA